MTDNEKLIEAAMMLQENCEQRRDNCENGSCIFNLKGECRIQGRSPRVWNVPTPRRFTDADIALAKALKEFGADKVCYDDDAEHIRVYYTQDGYTGAFQNAPKGAFEFVKITGKAVSIDDIIKEVNQ